jgi:23S rRNA (cytosine1962-C5)-methyltransferase
MSEPLAMGLARAFAARAPLLDAAHEGAVRLFNGFAEGNPDLVIDLYGTTAIIHNYAEPAALGTTLVEEALGILLAQLPWLESVIVKTRHSAVAEERRGQLVFGDRVVRKVREHGIWYAVDLMMNRDASLYLDTRNLREWALRHLQGRTVLNTFAYTGSLGVAALAGGAARVAQLDRNGEFLTVAKASYALNGFPVQKKDFLVGDFFAKVSYLKKAGERFDCIFLDPPFFATGPSGTVDLVNDSARLINKVRPLINDGGFLVAINNALFVSGQAYLETLHGLCADGYMKVVERIAVPADFTGFPDTRTGAPVTDPAPFNHATKIAILEVRRKVPSDR